jgi:type III pantothenate kinase
MTNLVIDIGNTLTKVAIFNERILAKLEFFEDLSASHLKQYIEGKNISSAIISTVDKEIDDLESVLKASCKYRRFSASTPVNVINHYKTPQTLGLDRLAAVIGAQSIYPGQSSLVIDAGSCITYDLIDGESNYYGGSISPGISMRFNAVHTFTGRLPLIEPEPAFDGLYGSDTRSAIISGIQNGVWSEAMGFMQSYSAQYPDLQIILCGGDVIFFETRSKNSIFAPAVKTEPNLVLIGLNEVIYQQND